MTTLLCKECGTETENNVIIPGDFIGSKILPSVTGFAVKRRFLQLGSKSKHKNIEGWIFAKSDGSQDFIPSDDIRLIAPFWFDTEFICFLE